VQKAMPPSGPNVLRPGVYYPAAAADPPPPPKSTTDFYRPFKLNGETSTAAAAAVGGGGGSGDGGGLSGYRRQPLDVSLRGDDRRESSNARTSQNGLVQTRKPDLSSLAAACHTGE